MLIEGEAGIGKTHLVERLLDSLRTRPIRVFYGAARELQQTRPFGVIAAALECRRPHDDPRREAVGELLHPDVAQPAPSPTEDAGLQFRILDAIVDLVEEEALASPVLLVIEDLHWSDPATAMTLDAMVHRLGTTPLMVLLTMRAFPRSDPVTALVGSLERSGAERVALDSLGAAESLELAERLLRARLGPRLADRVRSAGGTPLLLVELVTALSERGSIRHTDGLAEITESDLPSTLREVVLQRIADLPIASVEVVHATAVLAGEVPADLLAAVAGVDVAGLAAAIRPAIRSGILEDGPDGLRFRHDLVQEVIYDNVPATLRAALHRDVARRLAAAGAPASIVAEHLWNGGTPGDVEAVDGLERAAAEASVRSPSVAVDLFRRAESLCTDWVPRRTDLAIQRAACLLWSGRVEECVGACRAILADQPDPLRRARASCWLGLAMLARGQMTDAADVFARAASVPTLDEVESVRLLAYTAQARALLGDLAGALETGAEARAAAAAAGDAVASCLAVSALTFATHSRGAFHDAVALAEEGVRLANASPGRIGHRFQMELFLANCLVDVDRLEDAMAAMERGLRLCAELGTRWNLPVHHAALAGARFVAGDWDDALAECATATELIEESGSGLGRAYALSIEGLVAVHRDELRRARAVIAAAEREQRAAGLQYRADWTMWARALALETDGRLDEGRRRLQATFDAAAALGFAAELPVLGPDLVRLALAVGDPAAAHNVAVRVAEAADGTAAVWVRCAALRCGGLADDDLDTLLAATELGRTAGRPFDTALSLEAAASALQRHGRVDEAVGLLREAGELHGGLRATRGVARVSASLRTMGVRPGVRGPRRRAATGWSSLTATESKVVELVAEGLSNPAIGARLFISPRTVQTHVRHVFAKLDLSTRSELAAAAARRAAEAAPHAPPG